jgi:polyphosphate kinase
MSIESLPETAGEAAAPALPSERLFSRELSWLAFNERVLAEAANPRQPLLERVKFAAIFTSNLDEFFMVRVSGLKQQLTASQAVLLPDGRTPAEELAAIRHALRPLLARHHRLIAEELLPALAAEGILVKDYALLDEAQRTALATYFEELVFPVCTPLAVDPEHPFPLISNRSVNLAVLLEDPSGEQRFARLKVPSVLPRLVAVPDPESDDETLTRRLTFTWLDQLVTAHLERLFPGMRLLEVHPFQVLRDAEIAIQELEAGDLLETMERGISRRRFNSVVALFVLPTMSDGVRALLLDYLELAPEDLWVVEGPLGADALLELSRVERPDLQDPPFEPHRPPQLRVQDNVFTAIRQGDLLLHHPYDSFGPVVELVERAAVDPDVLAIKQTLYRVGRRSPIVAALKLAAEEGKQVAALVELKARFDEDNNIEWARTLEQAGVHVTYGVVGLKTHCKLALVVRREGSGVCRYVHIGTGNYNPATAHLYTDLGLLTCDPELATDVSEVFNYLTGYSAQTVYRRLLVAPVNLRQGLQQRIEREIACHARGGQGRLIFKLNSLVDPALIDSLYQAAQAGVRVDLLVRGICCLRPDLSGPNARIRVVSIVGRFLEHSRVYYFHNGGEPEVLLGSADLMPRNLDRRVEVLAPVRAAPLRATIVDQILATYLADNCQAWELQPDGTYRRQQPANGEPLVDAQAALLARSAQVPERAIGRAMILPRPL